MESSKSPVGVFKGRVLDHRAQRHRIRCTSIESLVADEDQLEASVRYIDSKSSFRSVKGEWAQPRSVGTDTWISQD